METEGSLDNQHRSSLFPQMHRSLLIPMANDIADFGEDDKINTKLLTPLSIVLWTDSYCNPGEQNLKCQCLFVHPTVSLPDDQHYSLECRR